MFLTSYTVKAKTDIIYMIIGNRKAGLLDSEGLWRLIVIGLCCRRLYN